MIDDKLKELVVIGQFVVSLVFVFSVAAVVVSIFVAVVVFKFVF